MSTQIDFWSGQPNPPPHDPVKAFQEDLEAKLKSLVAIVATNAKYRALLSAVTDRSEVDYRLALAKVFAEDQAFAGVADFSTVRDSAVLALAEIQFDWFVNSLEARNPLALRMDVSSESRTGALLSTDQVAMLKALELRQPDDIGKHSDVDPRRCPYCSWDLSGLETDNEPCDHLRACWQDRDSVDDALKSSGPVQFLYPSLADRPRWSKADGPNISATAGLYVAITDLYQRCRELSIRLFEAMPVKPGDPPETLLAAKRTVVQKLGSEDDPADDPIDIRWWPLVEDQLRLAPNGSRMNGYLFDLWASFRVGLAGVAGNRSVIWAEPEDELRLLATIKGERDQLAHAISYFHSARDKRFRIFRISDGHSLACGTVFDNRLEAEQELALCRARGLSGTNYELRELP